MMLKSFEEFVSIGTVKKQTPNKQRALSLLKEVEEKRKFLDLSIKNIPSNQMHPNFIVDSCYDIIMQTIRAKMFIDGYNAGNSHEAEVSYMEKLSFSNIEVRFMDEIRYYRNGTKYYGTIVEKEYAFKVLRFMEKMLPRLKKLIMLN